MTPEEYAQHYKEQAIANNDAWQLRNIEQYLQPYVEFCKQRNVIGAQKAVHDYAEAESRRLKARADLMERYDIERLPNKHRDKAVACLGHQTPEFIQGLAAHLTLAGGTGMAALRHKFACVPLGRVTSGSTNHHSPERVAPPGKECTS